MDTHTHIFVLAGPSGVGKSTVLEYMKKTYGAQTAPKYTTRPSRQTKEDEQNFIFCKLHEFPKSGLLTFGSYGQFFAIQLDEIDKSIQQSSDHVLVVGDPGAVRQLSSIYMKRIARILVYCEMEQLRSRVFADPSTGRAARWEAIEKEVSEIYDQLDCVDFVVNNSGTLEETYQQVRSIYSYIHSK